MNLTHNRTPDSFLHKKYHPCVGSRSHLLFPIPWGFVLMELDLHGLMWNHGAFSSDLIKYRCICIADSVYKCKDIWLYLFYNTYTVLPRNGSIMWAPPSMRYGQTLWLFYFLPISLLGFPVIEDFDNVESTLLTSSSPSFSRAYSARLKVPSWNKKKPTAGLAFSNAPGQHRQHCFHTVHLLMVILTSSRL